MLFQGDDFIKADDFISTLLKLLELVEKNFDKISNLYKKIEKPIGYYYRSLLEIIFIIAPLFLLLYFVKWYNIEIHSAIINIANKLYVVDNLWKLSTLICYLVCFIASFVLAYKVTTKYKDKFTGHRVILDITTRIVCIMTIIFIGLHMGNIFLAKPLSHHITINEPYSDIVEKELELSWNCESDNVFGYRISINGWIYPYMTNKNNITLTVNNLNFNRFYYFLPIKPMLEPGKINQICIIAYNISYEPKSTYLIDVYVLPNELELILKPARVGEVIYPEIVNISESYKDKISSLIQYNWYVDGTLAKDEKESSLKLKPDYYGKDIKLSANTTDIRSNEVVISPQKGIFPDMHLNDITEKNNINVEKVSDGKYLFSWNKIEYAEKVHISIDKLNNEVIATGYNEAYIELEPENESIYFIIRGFGYEEKVLNFPVAEFSKK